MTRETDAEIQSTEKDCIITIQRQTNGHNILEEILWASVEENKNRLFKH